MIICLVTTVLQVTGENEFTPEWSSFNRAANIAENSPSDTTVLQISATDDDEGVDGVLSYAIVSISTSEFAD